MFRNIMTREEPVSILAGISHERRARRSSDRAAVQGHHVTGVAVTAGHADHVRPMIA
jgi:hypothetical protein